MKRLLHSERGRDPPDPAAEPRSAGAQHGAPTGASAETRTGAAGHTPTHLHLPGPAPPDRPPPHFLLICDSISAALPSRAAAAISRRRRRPSALLRLRTR